MNKIVVFCQLDDFEEIVLTGPSTRLPNCCLHDRGKCTYPLGKDSLSPRDPDDAVCRSELYGVSSQENPQTSGTACFKFSQSYSV